MKTFCKQERIEVINVFIAMVSVFFAINAQFIWSKDINEFYRISNILLIGLSLILFLVVHKNGTAAKVKKPFRIMMLLWACYAISFCVSEVIYGQYYDAIPMLIIVPCIFFMYCLE